MQATIPSADPFDHVERAQGHIREALELLGPFPKSGKKRDAMTNLNAATSALVSARYHAGRALAGAPPPPMPDPLARVELAADAVRAARVEYRAALVAASEAGERASDIARAAGVSRQAISEILGKHSRSVQAASSPTE